MKMGIAWGNFVKNTLKKGISVKNAKMRGQFRDIPMTKTILVKNPIK